MDYNSTQFLTLSDIDTSGIDLFEDAFGLNTQFAEVIYSLKVTKQDTPSEELTGKLFDKIRNKTI